MEFSRYDGHGDDLPRLDITKVGRTREGNLLPEIKEEIDGPPTIPGRINGSPKVKDYRGWSQMRCDPDLEGEPKPTASTRWNASQLAVLDSLRHTVAEPLAWVAAAMRLRGFSGSKAPIAFVSHSE